MRVRVPAEHAQEAGALLNQRENVATGDDGAMAGAPLEAGGDSVGNGAPETAFDSTDLRPEEGGEPR